MGDLDKLLTRARQSPHNLRFEELCKLAEYFGFTNDRQRGSHCIYINLKLSREYSFMNFQEGRDGKAKPRQIKQLLEAIEHLE